MSAVADGCAIFRSKFWWFCVCDELLSPFDEGTMLSWRLGNINPKGPGTTRRSSQSLSLTAKPCRFWPTGRPSSQALQGVEMITNDPDLQADPALAPMINNHFSPLGTKPLRFFASCSLNVTNFAVLNLFDLPVLFVFLVWFLGFAFMWLSIKANTYIQ